MRSDGDPPLYPRIAAVATAVATVFVVLGVRLVGLTTGDESRQPAAAAANHFDIPAPRGTVWDRSGELLATEGYVYEIGVDLPAIEGRDVAAFAAAVAPQIGRQPADVEAAIRAGQADKRLRWVSLARGVDAAAVQRLNALQIGAGDAAVDLGTLGLTDERVPRRSFPLGAAAAHVTGMINVDGEANYGAEAQYDAQLTGKAGMLSGYAGTDPRAFEPVQPGADLRLTIDRDIQVAASEALAAAIAEQEAVGGTVIALDPATGAILALASWPSYDPNNYAGTDPALFNDPAISAIYEPGSVIKALTVAAALDAGAIDPNMTYEDEGTIDVGGIHIANWDRLAHGHTTLTQMLRLSLNVGAVHVAQALGRERFYPALANFGFGAKTEVDLVGEVEGLIHWPHTDPGWWEGYLASNSFGQGMSATPLQVVVAMSALAADGNLPVPHILAETIPPEGPAQPTTPRIRRQVIAPATARTVRAMLVDVVDNNVKHAAIPGYSVGGKTGTSQIPIPGGYDPEDTIASFCGFLPAGEPRVVILTKVDRPKGIRGGDVAGPLFRKVAEAAIVALDIAPDRPVVPVSGQGDGR
jgi:cell division protein FtsI (penicillin-binding protein 3)